MGNCMSHGQEARSVFEKFKEAVKNKGRCAGTCLWLQACGSWDHLSCWDMQVLAKSSPAFQTIPRPGGAGGMSLAAL